MTQGEWDESDPAKRIPSPLVPGLVRFFKGLICVALWTKLAGSYGAGATLPCWVRGVGSVCRPRVKRPVAYSGIVVQWSALLCDALEPPHPAPRSRPQTCWRAAGSCTRPASRRSSSCCGLSAWWRASSTSELG